MVVGKEAAGLRHAAWPPLPKLAAAGAASLAASPPAPAKLWPRHAPLPHARPPALRPPCSKWNVCHKAVASGAIKLPDDALPPVAEPKTEVGVRTGWMGWMGWDVGALALDETRSHPLPCSALSPPTATQIGKKFHLNTGLPYLKHSEPWWTFETEDTEEEEEGGKAASKHFGGGGDAGDGEAEERDEAEDDEKPPARPDAADAEAEAGAASKGEDERLTSAAAAVAAAAADAEEDADDYSEEPAAEE